MDVDEFTAVAGDAARMIYGERARIAVEESSLAMPAKARWVAAVKYRGEMVDHCRGSRPSEALTRLTGAVLPRTPGPGK